MEAEKRANLPWITIALIAVNTMVFVCSDLVFYNRQEEIAFYMSLNPVLVLKHGEYWRVVTSMFYHFGIDHLVYNMFMLYMMGAILEPFYGRIRYAILYFAAGLTASAASLWYNGVFAAEEGAHAFCAGASGAVYGLIGGYAAVYFVQRRTLPAWEKRRMLIAVLFLLFGSIFDTGIGHDAHFGGFFGGLLLGCVYCMILKKKAERERYRKTYGGGK